VIVGRELYHEEADLPPEHVPPPGGGVDVTFAAPPGDLPATDLRARCRTFWEFRVVAHTQSGGYDECFRLPVFAA
jgi:hypothetical protein